MGAFLLVLLFSTDFRGVWVPRWALSDESRIFTYLDGEFNHIFLQVFALGEAYYPSQYAPTKRSSDIWLHEFIAEAHRRNIKVSAWVNVFYSWGLAPRPLHGYHPMNRHPNWYLCDDQERSMLEYDIAEIQRLGLEGYYLAPANDQAKSYIFTIIKEILDSYAFDGIHLDYVRYPGVRFIYDAELRSKFMRLYYIDPLDLAEEPAISTRYSMWGYDDLQSKWRDFVHQDLTLFIRDLSLLIKRQNPHLFFSAAVKPDYMDARYSYFQDWATWLDAGYVDLVCLMAYTRNIRGYMKKTLKAIDDPARVVFGLGLFLLSPSDLARQVDDIRAQPFGGVVFFSYDHLKETRAYLNALK